MLNQDDHFRPIDTNEEKKFPDNNDYAFKKIYCYNAAWDSGLMTSANPARLRREQGFIGNISKYQEACQDTTNKPAYYVSSFPPVRQLDGDCTMGIDSGTNPGYFTRRRDELRTYRELLRDQSFHHFNFDWVHLPEHLKQEQDDLRDQMEADGELEVAIGQQGKMTTLFAAVNLDRTYLPKVSYYYNSKRKTVHEFVEKNEANTNGLVEPVQSMPTCVDDVHIAEAMGFKYVTAIPYIEHNEELSRLWFVDNPTFWVKLFEENNANKIDWIVIEGENHRENLIHEQKKQNALESKKVYVKIGSPRMSILEMVVSLFFKVNLYSLFLPYASLFFVDCILFLHQEIGDTS